MTRMIANTTYPHVSVERDDPSPVDESDKEQIGRMCRDILAPMVKADGGEMFLVRIEGDDVYIHLGAACAGCPGASMTSDNVILPMLRTVVPKVRVVLTTGVRLPEGASRL